MTSLKKPVILCISGKLNDNGVNRLYVNEAYMKAIYKAGGIGLMYPSLQGNNDIDITNITAIADGILLQGGCDIEPERYGAVREEHTGESDIDRDRLEIGVLSSGLPTLAICRGLQILNIARGGTLHQDVPSHKSANSDRTHLEHDIVLEKESKLYKISGSNSFKVNSLHHQTIDRLGSGLLISARSGDGSIEAVEDPHHPFMIGVQWHPEELYDSQPASRDLFEAFVTAARNHSFSK